MNELTVFVNEQAVRVPVGSTVLAAATRADPELGRRLAAGEAQATDARGLPLAPDAPLAGGSIVRVAGSARRRGADADA